MSRCFAFPPPGYEKKNIISDVASLTKEKHKEKKHKKEKSREKKEDKEKKDEQRSKEKRREKKKHKEKHKGKKDKKEKHRHKGNSHGFSNNNDKSEVQLNSVNGARFTSNVLQTQNHGFRNPNHVRLATRFKVEAEAAGKLFVQKTTVTDKGKNSGMVEDKEKNVSGGQILQKIELMDHGKIQLPRRTNYKNGCVFQEELNGKEKDKQGDDRSVNGCRNLEVVANFKNVYGGNVKPPDGKDVRYNNKQSGCRIVTNKKKDLDMQSETKEKGRDREEKAKDTDELSNIELGMIKDRSKLDDTSHNKTPEILAASGKIIVGGENLGKRKELEMNGFLQDNGSRPHKLKRPVASSQTATQNGKKWELCQTNGCKADSNVPGIKTTLINAPLNGITSRSSLHKAIEFSKIDGASMKPPHPDLIHLNRILSLAKLEKLPDFDDQEWLFCNTSYTNSSKMPRFDSSEEHVVWNEAINIESADISALPYVVPY